VELPADDKIVYELIIVLTGWLNDRVVPRREHFGAPPVPPSQFILKMSIQSMAMKYHQRYRIVA